MQLIVLLVQVSRHLIRWQISDLLSTNEYRLSTRNYLQPWLFSSQICAKYTIVSTALFISCILMYSSLECMACSPANKLGQGRPINDKRLPSVPPRILSVFTFIPALSMASFAFSTTCGC